MSSNPTISNEARVNISKSEYERLLEYEKICKDLFTLFRGDAEWVTLFHQLILKNMTLLHVKIAGILTTLVGMLEDVWWRITND